MKFHVGQKEYRIVVSNRNLFNESGDPLEGLVSERRKLIILSLNLAPQRREEVCLHEFFHAWLFSVPKPSTEEEHCQLFSLVSQQFYRELESQGGREALMQILPQPVQHLGEPEQKPPPVPLKRADSLGRPDRVVCGNCEAEVMCGSVNNGDPQVHHASGKTRILRWFQCDACGIVQVWLEESSPDGLPTGVFVANPPPRIIRGPAVREWLAQQADFASTM